MSLFEKKALDEIRLAVQEWEKKHEPEFKGERKTFVTESGIPIRRVYTPIDLAEKGFDYMQHLGLPGEYPYTRSIKSTGYRAALWGITGYGGKSLPEESNQLWKAQVAAGASTVSMAYDLPCQLGLDPDNPKAEGEVGRVGVSMVTQRDWEVGFEGIDFDKVGVYQVFNAPAVFGMANHNTVHLSILTIGLALGYDNRALMGYLLILRFTPRGFCLPRLDTTRSSRISLSISSCSAFLRRGGKSEGLGQFPSHHTDSMDE